MQNMLHRNIPALAKPRLPDGDGVMTSVNPQTSPEQPLDFSKMLLQLPIGAASPFWMAYMGAASAGAAYWWFSRLSRYTHLEALMFKDVVAEAQPIETVAVPAPVKQALKPVEAAVAADERAQPEPVAVKPAAQVTVAPKTVAPEPVVAKPVAPEPAAPAPVVQAPVVQASVAAKPVSPAPVVSAPVAAKPVAPAPVAPASVALAPIAAKPVASAPVAPAPVASAPVAPVRITPQSLSKVARPAEVKAEGSAAEAPKTVTGTRGGRAKKPSGRRFKS
jgi:cytoskeletal protein RodZ